MKLLNKTTSFYVIISLPILLIASVISYYLIKSELRESTDDALEREAEKAKDLIHKDLIQKTYYLNPDSLSYIKATNGNAQVANFSDILIYDKFEEEVIPYRKLTTTYLYKQRYYNITILKTTIEEDELTEGILSAFLVISLLLTVGFFIANWLFSKLIWKPFYQTLDALNKYDIKQHKEYVFAESNTFEFNQLNNTINKLISKIHQDYIQQKEFTENASHELQTPIAIIKAHINLLVQSTNLSEAEMGYVEVIENTLKKLSSLNKALLLLAKIENNQFNAVKQINISDVLSKTVHNIQELIQAKELNLIVDSLPNVSITMNPILSEIMISNLLQNAIRHNVKGGKIYIKLSNNKLIISNSGEPLNMKPEELFMRFKKDDSSKESIGIGLAIVKEIVALYNFNISYSFKNSTHFFELQFN